ncbi:MAG: nucleoside diphosphate kinase regulator [Bradyrhizobium sp.]
MTVKNMTNVPRTQLPPIKIRQAESKRLAHLAEASAETVPATAEFLAREIERATVVPDTAPLAGIVGMESEVTFRDDATGLQKQVTLVYPNAADIDAGRVSVLTPIGAALIGLSAGQAISFETPSGEQRSLTVLGVCGPN